MLLHRLPACLPVFRSIDERINQTGFQYLAAIFKASHRGSVRRGQQDAFDFRK